MRRGRRLQRRIAGGSDAEDEEEIPLFAFLPATAGKRQAVSE
jgi:hypothetical protein